MYPCRFYRIICSIERVFGEIFYILSEYLLGNLFSLFTTQFEKLEVEIPPMNSKHVYFIFIYNFFFVAGYGTGMWRSLASLSWMDWIVGDERFFLILGIFQRKYRELKSKRCWGAAKTYTEQVKNSIWSETVLPYKCIRSDEIFD